LNACRIYDLNQTGMSPELINELLYVMRNWPWSVADQAEAGNTRLLKNHGAAIRRHGIF